MSRNNCFLLKILLSLIPFFAKGQQQGVFHVFDAQTRQPVPFATIRFGNSGHGVIASLNGTFQLNATDTGQVIISCTGYKPQIIKFPAPHHEIFLEPAGKSLQEVIVKPPYDKIRRILRNAIANRNRNNPDKYDWYRCHVYYKMLADISLPDSAMADTTADRQRLRDFISTSHLLMSETYSVRTWKKPQQLQEDVIASRFSGFKKATFVAMVTDVLPFHAYNDYFNLNAKDYHNPVSSGWEQHYKYNLADELIEGKDTVWILSFLPKGHSDNALRGKVYISSAGFAISRIVAEAKDTVLKLTTRIEQQYGRLHVRDSTWRWFPQHLNYVIDWSMQSKLSDNIYHIRGSSNIDSVTWNEDGNYHFDKTHTVRLEPDAGRQNDSEWNALRPAPLDKKELRTYQFIDSLGEEIHLDRLAEFSSKLPMGKIPISIFDIDLMRLFSYNYYENIRLGLGMQTNDRLAKWLSAGAWAGYGFGDVHWKYGMFAELYADRYKEFVFRGGYTDDLRDPGRVHLNHDLDKNYLNSYLLQRVDRVQSYSASIKKKLGYWSLELSGAQQQITPQYHYALNYEGAGYSSFLAKEASLGLRYAYAERSAPMFDYYYSIGSKYPVWYGKFTTGIVENGTLRIPYSQAITAVQWTKHINHLGNERILLEGGKSWSDAALPLGKLFAGNGYRYDIRHTTALYTFGGMMTIFPYQYYTDQFINILVRHDFDWKLYKLETSDFSWSSAPRPGVQYNMLYGTLAHPEAQKYVSIAIPDNAYHEAGLILDNLLRLRFGHLYYLTASVGYFYHVTPAFDFSQNGRFVFGAGVEL